MAEPNVGVVLGSALAPEEIPGAAVLAEQHGFSSVWLSEDYFFTGGISSAATALALTERTQVGLGIVSAVTRHPALLAMELATLARMHPGRLTPAVGLGMPKWVAQMGLSPASALATIRANVSALRALLAGDEVSGVDGPFTFDRVRLTHPPDHVPPVWMGVSGPEMLRLAGEIADGVVCSVMTGPDYLSWARERITEGADRADRDPADISITMFAFASVSDDGVSARNAVRHKLAFYLSARPDSPITRAYGIADELRPLAAAGADVLEREMPDRWVEDLAIAGTPAECAAKIDARFAAGASAVALFPCPVEDVRSIVTLTGTTVLPLLATR